jgi:hypothetical protein
LRPRSDRGGIGWFGRGEVLQLEGTRHIPAAGGIDHALYAAT